MPKSKPSKKKNDTSDSDSGPDDVSIFVLPKKKIHNQI